MEIASHEGFVIKELPFHVGAFHLIDQVLGPLVKAISKSQIS